MPSISLRGLSAIGFFAVCLLMAGCGSKAETMSTAVKEELDKLRDQNEKYRAEVNKLQEDVIRIKSESNDNRRDLETANQAKNSIEKVRSETARQLAEANARLAAPYIHTVIFHLKAEAPIKEMIADIHRAFAKIASIEAYWVGKPAEMATPDRADKNYQLGLTIHFRDYDGLVLYLEDPKHKALEEKYQKHIDKMLVYDTLAEAPK